MSNIINITQGIIGGNTVQTVNARELHGFLGSKQDFSTWIKSRIEQYGFTEGLDFTLHKFVERRTTKIDYHISVDMAKELSMVERNEKGKHARQYFIECERQAKEAASRDPMELLNDPVILRQTLLGYSEKVLALEEKIQEQAPKVEAHDRLVDATGTLCLRDAAKTLQVQPSRLNRWMNLNGWIYRRPGKGSWIAYQSRIQSGHLIHKLTPYVDRNTGDDKVSEQVRVTGKGLVLLAKRLDINLSSEVVPPPKAGAVLSSAHH